MVHLASSRRGARDALPVRSKRPSYREVLPYTTKELSTPTKNTSKTHKPSPEKTVPLFSVQPCGEAKATGTPTTKRKDSAINANNVNWKRRVIS
jgi:hypothetical protein